MDLAAVFLGGGIGSVLRYLCNLFFARNFAYIFPFATFFENILGSLFLGFVLGIFMIKTNLNPQMKLFLTVGIAGGFTTFSTFTFETFSLLKAGHSSLAIIYPLSSIILGFFAVVLGFYLSRFF
jgi:CrcB protein